MIHNNAGDSSVESNLIHYTTLISVIIEVLEIFGCLWHLHGSEISLGIPEGSIIELEQVSWDLNALAEVRVLPRTS